MLFVVTLEIEPSFWPTMPPTLPLAFVPKLNLAPLTPQIFIVPPLSPLIPPTIQLESVAEIVL